MSRPLILTLVAGSLAGAPAVAAPVPPACKTVVDAGLRVITVPHHILMKEGDGPKTVEMITANGKNYIKVGGSWKTSPMTPDAMLAQEQENIRNASAYHCTLLADDRVDGAAAAVYKTHYETPDVGTSDAQIWISKATGLPLRIEEDLNFGSARHISLKYDYSNIQAPVVK